jgi:hypothetical protein
MTLDHYSLRRVEFKKAALWFNENARPSDRMLISERNVPNYYSTLEGQRFVASAGLKSADATSLIQELKGLNVSHVFIDDFYIRRLAVGDKNAIDRKAALLKEIRDNQALAPYFKPVARFEIKGNIRSAVYIFTP